MDKSDGEMDRRAANGIAANLRAIAQATVIITLADAGQGNFLNKEEARVDATREIEKAQARIAEWLTQPMTWR